MGLGLACPLEPRAAVRSAGTGLRMACKPALSFCTGLVGPFLHVGQWLGAAVPGAENSGSPDHARGVCGSVTTLFVSRAKRGEEALISRANQLVCLCCLYSI